MKNYLFAPFLFSPLSSPSSEGKFKMCKNFLFITPVKNKFKIWQILPVVCWWKGAKITQGENNNVYSISYAVCYMYMYMMTFQFYFMHVNLFQVWS